VTNTWFIQLKAQIFCAPYPIFGVMPWIIYETDMSVLDVCQENYLRKGNHKQRVMKGDVPAEKSTQPKIYKAQ
jgi:hypothetical protein